MIRDSKMLEAYVCGLMDSMPDASFMVDSTGNIVLVNVLAARMFGYESQELQGRSISTLIPERFRGAHAGHCADYSTRPRTRAMGAGLSIRALRKDGAEFPVEISLSPIETDQGTFVIGAIRDVGQSEERYRAIFEQVAVGVVHSNAEGRFLNVNPKFCEISGYTREEALALYIRVLTHPDDIGKSIEARARMLAGTSFAYEREERLIRKGGAEIWAHITTSLIHSADGRPVHFISLIHDISPQKQAEEARRESERRFNNLLQSVELVTMMLDRDACVTYCNDYLLRLIGWTREEVTGKNWFELFVPPENREELKDAFATLLANQPDALNYENEILTRSSERRLIRWNNTILRSPSGTVIGTASIGEDITEQKRAEIRIKRLNRVYAVLSGINTLIVRVRDRDELFNEACRIAVENGHFKMAWIGIADWSAMKIVPVASAGAEPEFLALIRDRFSLRGNTMSARAIREKKAIVSNDIREDPKIFFGKKRIERGISSIAVLPLLVSDEAAGVLVLYAGEIGFFDDDEMKLLTELAGDIAHAIDHIDKQARLDYLAYYDELTGLANRTLFLERVAQYMRSAASGGYKCAVALIDLERFKNINDSLGRPAGDALLRQVAEWMTRITCDTSLLARVGADHFAGVLPQVKQGGDVARLLEKTMAAFLEHPFRLNDAVFRVTVKVGIAVFPDDGADADTLFKNAEAALKQAKASGERYLFYRQDMTEKVAGKLTLENQLRQALDQGEFVLHYQPKVNLASGKLIGAEALIRWNDPRTGLVPPGLFIPVLEETGMIYDVGRWALRQAIADYLRWRAASLPAVRIAVNVSPLQLRNHGFVAEVEQAIGIDTQAAAGLELEITESLIMDDVKHNIASLQAIRALGVTIAIDDFGTGFSSLSYLAKLPADTLKIDRSFVIDMTAGPKGLGLVSTIIKLAHSLKLTVVAEGVETEEQARLLRLLSCDEMQGFLFSKPVPSELFETRFLVPPPTG